MGTRSTVRFFDEEDKLLVTVYQQYDGYPHGVGKELATFLSKFNMINGIRGQQLGEAANGIGCLAAQFISEFKTRVGGLYLESSDCEEEYNYSVKYSLPNNKFHIKMETGYDESFDGTLEEFVEYCDKST